VRFVSVPCGKPQIRANLLDPDFANWLDPLAAARAFHYGVARLSVKESNAGCNRGSSAYFYGLRWTAACESSFSIITHPGIYEVAAGLTVPNSKSNVSAIAKLLKESRSLK
jgi:hypothetical protein